MLAAGGEHASDLDILRSSPEVFGQLPSNATVSRFFERTVTNPELFGYGFETLTRELRIRAWEAAGNLEEPPNPPCLLPAERGTHPVPTNSTIIGSGTGANPGEPTGHPRLPEKRIQPPISRGHKSVTAAEHHEKSRLTK